MFTTKEQEIINWGLQNGKSKEEVQTALANYRLGIIPEKTQTTQQKPSFGEDFLGDIKQTGTSIANRTVDAFRNSKTISQQQGNQSVAETALQGTGNAAGYLSGVFGDIITGVGKAVLPQSAETGIKTGVTKATQPIINTELVKGILSKYNSLDERTKRNIDASLGIGSLALDVATSGLIGKGAGAVANKAVTTGEQALKVGGDTFDVARNATKNLIEKAGTPKPTAIQATKNVLQGKTKDVVSGVRGIAKIDTTGVKTFDELLGKVKGGITKFSEQVDKDLATDTTKKTLKNLVVTAESAGGRAVKYNPVERALNQLEELYLKIGDDVKATNVRETLNIAKKEGLTNLEVNDIAKIYGEEFGTKAFSKLGDPLTSVNAQLYENTRKSLKDVARSGLKGAEAKAADKTISDLYRVQSLVQKNVEAVNKLQQKIQQRGLLEKVGYGVAKTLDTISGGSLRGIAGGLLPRGVGYKVMNAIDIEKQLGTNLKIIQEAIKAGEDKEILKILGKLKTTK